MWEFLIAITTWVLIYILWQILQNFFLLPLAEYNKEKWKIIQSIIFYSNKIFNDVEKKDKLEELSIHFRNLASSFISSYYSIPYKHKYVRFGLIIKEEDMDKISWILIGISNSWWRFWKISSKEYDYYTAYHNMVKEMWKILKVKLI